MPSVISYRKHDQACIHSLYIHKIEQNNAKQTTCKTILSKHRKKQKKYQYRPAFQFSCHKLILQVSPNCPKIVHKTTLESGGKLLNVKLSKPLDLEFRCRFCGRAIRVEPLTRIDHTGILWLSPGTLFLPADCWICWVRWILSTSDDYPDVKLDPSRLGQTFSDHN